MSRLPIGTIIRITDSSFSCGGYAVGDRAKVYEYLKHGTMYCDFNGMGNSRVHMDGRWAVPSSAYEVVGAKPPKPKQVKIPKVIQNALKAYSDLQVIRERGCGENRSHLDLAYKEWEKAEKKLRQWIARIGQK
jgi:hypothetical protein